MAARLERKNDGCSVQISGDTWFRLLRLVLEMHPALVDLSDDRCMHPQEVSDDPLADCEVRNPLAWLISQCLQAF
jgi:hypothetical protein